MKLFTDLSDVLMRGVGGTEEIVAAIYGEAAGKQFKDRFESPCVQEWFCHLLRGRYKEYIFWMDFVDDNKQWPYGSIEAEEMFDMNLGKPRIEGTLELYKSIKSHPKTIGSDEIIEGTPEIWLVSDHIEECIPELYGYHSEIFEIMKETIWSCKLDMIKSDPEFFGKILSDYRLDPKEIILVDDLEKNIRAAEEYGIPCILFKNAGQLKKDLEEKGFKFTE